MIYDFSLNYKEQETADKWMVDHEEHCSECNTEKLDGSCFSFIFTPSPGLGFVIEIKCTLCGKEKNVTDYDNW